MDYKLLFDFDYQCLFDLAQVITLPLLVLSVTMSLNEIIKILKDIRDKHED